MDPEHYEKQAAKQREKAAKEMAKHASYEKQAADLDQKATREEAAASSSRSTATQRSKQRSAASHRKQAAALRQKAAGASRASADAQSSANDYQRKADDERARRSKNSANKAERDTRDAKRAAEREQRQRASIDRAVSTNIRALHARTDNLAAAIAQSRRDAPRKITVLLMAGTPEGGAQALRLDREGREIDAKVRAGKHRDQIELRWTHATQIRDIVDALNRYEPDVVHFSGHGGKGSLLFEGPDGTPQALSGDQLGLLLQAAPRAIRLVVFNACESADQALAAIGWSEFAIGMERSVNDEAAKEWAGQFYGSLAAGETVALAFRQATAHATVLTSEDAAGAPRLSERAGSDAEATVLVAPDETDMAA